MVVTPLTLSYLLILVVTAVTSSSPPLHIVLVIVDDVGTADLEFSAYNGTTIQTPFLTSLASQSIRLRTYYAHPTCTPTRAALMTGRYAHNTGLPFPLIGNPMVGLDVGIPVLPELLQQRGYTTHMVGKWHLGHSKMAYTPTRRGFESFYGLHGGGFDHYTKITSNLPDLWENTERITQVNVTQHATELFTDKAIEVIQKHSRNSPNDPMFLYLSYTAAHDPLQADEIYIKQCSHIPCRTRRLFCAMMRQLDNNVARLKKALVDTAMWDNTLFIFTSDNGGMPVCGGFNYPLRGAKSMAWEGGVRIPGFIHAPPHMMWKSGDYEGLVHVADWLPTLLSIVDTNNEAVESPLPGSLDGVDMSQAFATYGESPRKSAVLQQDIFLNSTSFRSGCLKLLLGCPGQPSVYKEPTESLFNIDINDVPLDGVFDDTFAGVTLMILQCLIDSVEYLISPPLDQFYKYIIVQQFSKLNDYSFGTSFTHILTRYQLNSFTADLKVIPPTLEWDSTAGPRVLLFDICTDPQERNNLAPTHRADVERLYQEFRATIAQAPIQFAGDVLDDKAPPGSDSGPWLDDDTPVTGEEGTTRLFIRFEKLTGLLSIAVCAVFLVVVGVSVCLCYFCCRGKKQKTKIE